MARARVAVGGCAARAGRAGLLLRPCVHVGPRVRLRRRSTGPAPCHRLRFTYRAGSLARDLGNEARREAGRKTGKSDPF